MPDTSTDTIHLEHELSLHTLRLVLIGAAVVFAGLVLRNLFAPGENPWADPANLALILGCIWWLRRSPHALRPVSWVVLVSFTANVLVSLVPWEGSALTPTHLLLPLLVLYGVLLADLALTAAGVIVALAVIWYGAEQATMLTDRDVLFLTDLAVCVLAIAALSLAVREIQRKLLRRVHERGIALERQLEANQRLNATIFHDIANPLTALQATLTFVDNAGRLAGEDVQLATRATQRIASIMEAVREMNRPGGSTAALPLASVDVDTLSRELHEVFAPRLHAKEQTFQVVEGAGLQVYTNHTIMCHSVLANLLSNAIKFSPRGARISIAARQENDRVHIAVRDGGAGFPAEVMREQADATRTHLTSHAGTELEQGTGVGLRIAQHYLRELDGTLRIANRPDGGAEVTAILPVKTARSRNTEVARAEALG